jgi:hypothetical protein
VPSSREAATLTALLLYITSLSSVHQVLFCQTTQMAAFEPKFFYRDERETGDISSPQPQPVLIRFAKYIVQRANFFRLHLIAFTLIPLIFSGIFYASNGQFHIDFLDSMFLCYSAMTVTGLSTVNLSTLTGWQQAILFLLMIIVSFLKLALSIISENS